jgi:hypothetical protein
MPNNSQNQNSSLLPTVSPEQLRADLEALYDKVDRGWCRYGPQIERFGVGGGCLGQQMNQVMGSSDEHFVWDDAQRARWYALTQALGFWGRSYTAWPLHLNATIPAWNDKSTTTWQDVKDRVKDAIGRL